MTVYELKSILKKADKIFDNFEIQIYIDGKMFSIKDIEPEIKRIIIYAK